MYCQTGDKPRIEYVLGDGKKRSYQSNIAPIGVNVVSRESLKTYKYFDANLPGQREYDGTDYRTESLSFCQQGGTRIIIFNNGATVGSSCIASGTLQIIPAAKQTCDLIITNSSGQQIFKVTGDCPINYNVVCGNCPPGHIECKTNKHPGYCCIPCQETAAKINNLAAKARCCNG